jgi:hypothetical protein
MIDAYSWKAVDSLDKSCPNIRSNGTAIWHEDSLWLIGGRSVDFSNDVWTFSIRSKKWKQILCSGSVFSPRDGHAACATHEGKVFLFGGQTKPTNEKVSTAAYTKIKWEFLATRTTLNDLFMLDCVTQKWTEMLDRGVKPPSRRGHSLLYFATSDPVLVSTIRGTAAGLSYTTSFEDERKYEFLILFGGSGVDPVKMFERLLNDVWTYDIEQCVWRIFITSGSPPIPCYQHAAVFKGENMVVLGGILDMTTNNSVGIDFDNEDHRARHDNGVMVLNIRTKSWTRIPLHSKSGQRVSIHFHSLCAQAVPDSESGIFIFGGKVHFDASTHLSKSSNKTWLTADSESHMATSIVNFKDGTIEHFHISGTRVEPRYAHCVVPVQYSMRRTQIREEHNGEQVVLMMMYGGLRTSDCGFCSSHIYELMYCPIMNQRRNAISFDRVIDVPNDLFGAQVFSNNLPKVENTFDGFYSRELKDASVYRNLLNSNFQEIKKALTKPVHKKVALHLITASVVSPSNSPKASPPASPTTIGAEEFWESPEKSSNLVLYLRDRKQLLRDDRRARSS